MTVNIIDYTNPNNSTNTPNFPNTFGLTGQVLTSDGSGNIIWQFPSFANDPNPTLSGNLNVGNYTIQSNSNITLMPSPTGNVIFGGLKFPNVDGLPNQFLSTDGHGNLSWVTPTTGITSISQDTSPTLGGNLNVNNFTIYSSNNIALNPTGNVIISGLKYPNSDGQAGQSLVTNGYGVLSWGTVLTKISDDKNPSLGGNLNTNGYTITSPTGITLQSSNILLNGMKFPSTIGSANQVLTTDGAGNLSWKLPQTVLLNDPSPTLSADLNLNNKRIVSSSNIVVQTPGVIDLKSFVRINQGNFLVDGDAEAGFYVLRYTTSDEYSHTLFLDGTSTKLSIPSNTTWNFSIQIIARSDNGNSAYFVYNGAIKNTTITQFIGTPTLITTASDTNIWSVALAANTQTTSLDINVTGQIGANIRWVAFVKTVEVSGIGAAGGLNSSGNTNSSPPPASAVFSVAGKTGNVILTATDISGLGTLATQNTVDWNTQVTNEPVIPTKTSQLVNDSGYITGSSLATVATTGSYLDLSNLPIIPTQTSQLTNDSGYITSNLVTSVAGRTGAITLSVSDISGLSIPTAVSQLTNDSGYITSNLVTSVAGRTGAIVLTTSDISGLSIPTEISQLTNDAGYITSNLVTSVAGRTGAIVLTTFDISGLGTLASQNAVDWNNQVINEPTIPTRTSQLVNDSGFVTQSNVVTSVNGRTGAITLSISDISGLSIPTETSQLTNDSGYITSNLVTSVAGRTGAIVLSTADISGLGTLATKNTVNWNTDIINEPTIPTQLSQLTNDVGYASATNAVTSVNGRTGAITLSISDISGLSIPTETSQLTNDSGYITSAPVTSVAGRTGEITLTTADISGLGSLASLNTIDWNTNIINEPTIPTKVSQLTNDAGYVTTTTIYSLGEIVRMARTGETIITGNNTMLLMDGRSIAASSLANASQLETLIPGAFSGGNLILTAPPNSPTSIWGDYLVVA